MKILTYVFCFGVIALGLGIALQLESHGPLAPILDILSGASKVFLVIGVLAILIGGIPLSAYFWNRRNPR